MNVEITIPEMGESVTSGIVAAWLKENGEYVTEGEDLFELETDKATVAVPSSVSGTLLQKVDEGDEVEVGYLVATIDTDAPKPADSTPQETEIGKDQPKSEKNSVPNPVPAEVAVAAPVASAPSPQSPKVSTIPADVVVSPSVRRIVEQYDIEFSSIQPSRKDGLITKEDALAALLTKAEKLMTNSASLRASSANAKTGVAVPALGGTEAAKQIRKPMTNIRKRIAENLVQSQKESAQLTTFNEIDMSAVMQLRKTHRDAFEAKHGVRLGFMSFFVKASCVALEAFPQANSAIDGDDLLINNTANIGVAVSTERGLLVPVVRDAEAKSFAEIESDIISFAVRAKEKKISLDELTGGTFTITNGGVFGSLLSTPIATPGQTAILGMHSIQKRPVAINDEVVIRPMMYVAVTYDHRVMDGREAVSFLVKIKQLVEDPGQLLLGL